MLFQSMIILKLLLESNTIERKQAHTTNSGLTKVSIPYSDDSFMVN
jgi:hypothetical protein